MRITRPSALSPRARSPSAEFQPRHDAVAVHGGAEMAGGDEEILLPRLLVDQVGIAAGVDLQGARDEVSFLGNHVTVFADACDHSLALERLQHGVQLGEIRFSKPQSFGKLQLVQRLIAWLAQPAEEPLPDSLLPARSARLLGGVAFS